MAKKSLIYREKKRQKLEQKYHLIRRSLKKEISEIPSLGKWFRHVYCQGQQDQAGKDLIL